MAASEKDTNPICDVDVLKTKRVDLVKQIVLENVMPSVKPFLLYTQVDAINNAELGRNEKIGKLLDILQMRVLVEEYTAFNAFILSLAGTQPALFRTLCGRSPAVTESDFCMKDVLQEMKTTVDSSKHHKDSDLDEQIDFLSEYVELSMVEKAAVERELACQRGRLPHEYCLHLDEVHGRDRNIKAFDVLGNEEKPHGKVSIYGRAGIGKSTTLQFLAKQWALGRWAARFTMLFLLQLRFLTMQVIAISTVELLQLYGLYNFPDHSDSTAFTSWLKNCTSRILILIDGLDEIPGFAERMMNTQIIHDVLQKANPVDLCINILRGDLLPGCTVISASRPFAGLSQLPADARAEILGLTSAKVTEYVEHRHPNQVKNIMSVLRKNPILLSVCSIVFYCMMITRLLSEGVTIFDEDIKTYTRLMSFITIQYCMRKASGSHILMEDTSYFSKIAQLAYSGIFLLEDNEGLAKIVFDEDDLIKANIKTDDLDNMKKSGIIQVTIKNIGRHNNWTSEFFHMSVEELLAVAHFLLHPLYPKNALNQLFQSEQFNLALQFIFGLHCDKNNEWIRNILKAVNAQSVSDGIEPELSSFINSILEQKLKVCQLIHEGQWEEKAKEVVSYIAPDGKLEIKYASMSAIDLLALDYVCRSLGSLNSITLGTVHADDTFVTVLLSSLYEHHWKTLQVLNLGHNSIGDAGTAAIADSLCSHNEQTLQVLNLEYNNVGADGAAAIAKILHKHNNQTLQVLDLENNAIGDGGAAAIANSLSKGDPESEIKVPILRKLNLPNTEIGGEGAMALGRMLANNDNLRHLDVGRNKIEEEGVKAIANGLTQNVGLERLELNNNHVGEAGAGELAEMLLHNTCLKVLDLGESRLGDEGVKVLGDGLHRNTTLTQLKLYGNDIGDQGAASVATMLSHNTSLKNLDLSDNQIGDAGVQAIADSMVCNTSVTRLNLSGQGGRRGWCLGDTGAVAIAEMLLKNKSLEALGICRNNIGDDGAAAIATVLHQNTSLVDLDISDNMIGDTGIIAVANMLHKNNGLVGLNISRNNIGDVGARAIAHALREEIAWRPARLAMKVKIDVSHNKIGPKAIEALADISNNANITIKF